MVAELTIAGLGISMLPPEIFRPRIESGDLCELKTEPPIAPLEFWAVRARQHVSPVTETIAELAREASTFHFDENVAERLRGSGPEASSGWKNRDLRGRRRCS